MNRKQSLPQVSAIIPTRNRPEMLIRAAKSVANQTYQNIEIIIVDDGSEYDLEGFIMKEKELQACRFLRNTRRPGPAGARNTGFYQSKGEFVGFLDDDDEWTREKIEKQILAFQRSNESVGVVCTHDIVVRVGSIEVRSRQLEGNVYSALCKAQIAGNSSNPLIKKHVLKEVGLFDEDMPAAQDTDLWLRIAKRFDFKTVAEPLVLVHRDGPDRISENYEKKLVGTYMLLRKHWGELDASRKFGLIRYICRLSFDLACKRFSKI